MHLEKKKVEVPAEMVNGLSFAVIGGKLTVLMRLWGWEEVALFQRIVYVPSERERWPSPAEREEEEEEGGRGGVEGLGTTRQWHSMALSPGSSSTERACVRVCVCVCVCVCVHARARARVCVWVCVWMSWRQLKNLNPCTCTMQKACQNSFKWTECNVLPLTSFNLWLSISFFSHSFALHIMCS